MTKDFNIASEARKRTRRLVKGLSNFDQNNRDAYYVYRDLKFRDYIFHIQELANND